MTEYLIKTFPMPPSSNAAYCAVNGRLIKSAEGRLYDKHCEVWALKNWKVLDAIKRAVDATKLPYAVELDAAFVFLEARLISKKNELKRLDATNRLKLAHDNFCKAAGFDDCKIIAGKFEKITCTDARHEGVIFKLRLAKLKTLAETLESTITTNFDS